MPDLTPDFDQSEQELQALAPEPSPTGAPRHPSLELLRAAGQDVLPPEVEARVSQHLRACALCIMLLKDLATLPEPELTQAQTHRISQAFPQLNAVANSRRPYGVIVAIAAAVLFAAFLFIPITHVGRGSRVASNPADKAPIETPAPILTAQSDIHVQPLAPPADSPANLQTRGGATHASTLEALIPAFTAYRHADYTTAVTRLTGLAQRYPGDSTVALYLGVSQLMLHQDQTAYTTLTQAQSLHPTPAAQWYTAVAAQHLRAPEAAPLLRSICADTRSPYSAQACEAATMQQPR